MMANAALSLGLAQHCRKNIDYLMDMLPFEFARHNFFEAAKNGIDAMLVWGSQAGAVREYPVTELLMPMLEGATEGLMELGVNSKEANKWMSVIERRLASRQTGAVWQLASLMHYEQRQSRYQALSSMFSDYRANSLTGEAVSGWTIH